MSAKRNAPYTINEKTLEQHECAAQEPPQDQPPAERVIVSVKKDEAGAPKEPQEEEKKEQKPLLFSNQFNNNGVGLFSNVGLFNSNNPPTAAAKPAFPPIDTKSPNLFSGNGKEAPKLPGSASLFGGSSGSGSIFGFQEGTKVPPKKAGEEDDEGDSAELEKVQSMEVDRSKSKGIYKYEDEMESLFTGIARKFKKGNGELIEGVEVVLQKDPKAQVTLLVVRLTATKNNIFTGVVMPGISEVRTLNGKDENIEVSAFVMSKGAAPQRFKIKLQFETTENGTKFSEKANQVISSKPAEKKEPKADNKEAANTEKKEEQAK